MPEAFEEQLELAEVYAAALFRLASEEEQVEEVREELDQLVDLMMSEPDFANFMTSGSLTLDHRASGLERMFRGRISNMVLNTLQVMNQHGRCGVLRALLRCYVLHEERAANQVEVVATSAAELDEEQRQAVVSTAAALSGKVPLVEYVVDPSVIGGLVLQIDDWRYDNSVRRQLQTARAQLRERGERGLKVGTAD